MLIDACGALAAAAEQCVEGAQAVVEQGLVVRMYELCENTNVREAAVLVLCNLLRSPDPLHRRVVLSSRFPGVLRHVIEEFSNTASDKSRADIAHGLRTLLGAEAKYIVPCLQLGIIDHIGTAIVKGVFEVNVQAGHCLCLIILGCTEGLLPSIASAVSE